MRASRGQTLIALYMVIIMLSVLGGSFVTKGMAVNQHSRIMKLDTEIFYLAQGGVEDATASLVNAIATFQISSNPEGYPDTDGDSLFNTDFSTDLDKIITTFCAQSAACPNSPFPAGSTPRARSYVRPAEPTERLVTEADGTAVRLRNYEIVTAVAHPTHPTMTTTLHQVVTRRLVYTFQHAVFYNDDLEILPGANMTLSGRIHTNNNLYLDANGSSLLTLDTDYVRTPANLYNYRKQTGTPYPGSVTIKQWNTNPAQYVPLTTGNDSTNPSWATLSQTHWLSTGKTGVHGVTAMAVPTVASTSPSGSDAYYANNADIKVTNGLIQRKVGASYVNVIECAPATVNAGNQATCVPLGTITTNPTDPGDSNRYYNSREGKIVKMTNLDLKRLGGYYDVNGDTVLDPPGTAGNPYLSNLPANGLLYATRNDAAATEEPGIRLRNGSVINRSGGLAVVSNDPVYLQGDFNTVNKRPVSVIGDALHLVSNNWQDSNSYKSLSNRIANPTTYNTAFIAGIKTTTAANYNGGLENYPRLQENWSSKTLTIRGSFVELWNSQIAVGNWPGTGSVYNPPIRSWSYETDFSSGSLPPFTPFAVEALRGAWWKE